MKKTYHFLFTLLAALSISSSLFAQNNFFTDAGANTIRPTNGQKIITPEKFRAADLNITGMKNFLWSLPVEKNVIKRNLAPVMELPMPDGRMARFHVWESSIMEPGLADKFPEMKTFAGQGIDDPYATIRFDYNPYFGFSAQVLSVNGNFLIDAYARRDVNQYISYYTRDNQRPDPFHCEVTQNIPRPENAQAGPCRGAQLYTYRLALACTGEYAVAVAGPGPTVPAVAAAMLTSVNRVSGVYESELAVRLVLVSNNNLLIYLDGTTDPYTNNNGGTMLGQNQTNIDNIIGNANYDIGHVFSTGGGGVAFLGIICQAGFKARGVTGLSNPVGDNFDIDYVAHEMGHQFGGNHTFNSVTGSCGGGNRNGSTAYEVGSATSIMGYAGICGTDNTQPHSDPFFHTISFDEIGNYIAGTGGSCPVITSNGNILPVITAMNNNNISIPLNTPFTLSATATDANGDALTYCWEEWDLGPGGAWNGGATSINAPLFKSRVPVTTGNRTFPDMAVILAGYPVNPPATMGGLKGETLPLVGRAMKFRLTVRDNRAGGGGVVTGGEGCQAGFTGTFQVNAIDATGPFIVTAPNGGESFIGGTTQNITWNVAGTNAAPINVSNVKISLSTDGGVTYPTVLSASTANDGTETITIPCIPTTTAKIKIEAVGNIFFDISNNDFAIQSGFAFSSPSPAVSSCPVPASMSIVLGNSTCSFANPINLAASGVPPGTTVSYSSNPVAAGSNVTVTLNGTNTLASGSYIITITGTSAGAPTQTRNLTYTISTAASATINTPPASQTLCVGSNATFTIAATGASGYQWQLSTNGGTSYADIPGATGTSYLASAVTASMNGYRYQCVVSAACAPSVTSSAAILTVISPVTIAAGGQPANSEKCSGSNTTFTVTGTSTQPISYQWQVSTVAVPAFINIPGANTSTLSLASVTTGMNGNQYRCLLSNTTCTAFTISNVVLLTVRQLPTVTLVAAPLTNLLPGQVTTLTATPSASTGGTITTNWIKNGTGFTNIGNTYVANVEALGTYSVAIQETFTGGLVCSNQSADVIIGATVSSNLFIFPSPNDGNFTVSYYNADGASTQRKITIFDSKGAMVYNRQFNITGPYTLIPINLQNANRGIYYVVVGNATGKKLATGKVHVR
ncbi:MAG: T9SS type A sorting domain-containing protein [Chitinophagaceae bacterium]|nr:T9SS type A sorting domain-containing protein [Chitinophagaceae bacterium]